MNIFLWLLQVLLALHTAIGAGWKLFNSEQTIPNLSAIPHYVWLLLTPLEIAFAAGLVLPAFAPSLKFLVPIAAAGIGLEMLMFSVVHLSGGANDNGPMYYWLGVAGICMIIVVGRVFLVRS